MSGVDLRLTRELLKTKADTIRTNEETSTMRHNATNRLTGTRCDTCIHADESDCWGRGQCDAPCDGYEPSNTNKPDTAKRLGEIARKSAVVNGVLHEALRTRAHRINKLTEENTQLRATNCRLRKLSDETISNMKEKLEHAEARAATYDIGLSAWRDKAIITMKVLELETSFESQCNYITTLTAKIAALKEKVAEAQWNLDGCLLREAEETANRKFPE